MTQTLLALPVSVEQVAMVIRQMGPTEQIRLLTLVPSLQALARQPERTKTQAQITVEQLQLEFATMPTLSLDTLFIDKITLRDYLALPPEQQQTLWNNWIKMDWSNLTEHEVNSDTMEVKL
jgi:hypothetical protein